MSSLIRKFELLHPDSVEQACGWLAENDECRPIAGGTALAILLKQGLFRPEALVSLRDIPGLNYLEHKAGKGLRIGAMFSQHGLEISDLLKAHYPILASAASKVGNIRVRCQSTIGGTLCEADHQADVPPVLVALDATLSAASRNGIRQIAVAEFYRGHYETALEPGEILIEVQVPELATGTVGTYLKHVTGPITDRPCVGVAVLLRADEGGRIAAARIVVGGVSYQPWRVAAAEAALLGEPPSASLFEKAAAIAYEQADPLSDLRGSAWYKREMVNVFVRRALEEAAEQLTGVQS